MSILIYRAQLKCLVNLVIITLLNHIKSDLKLKKTSLRIIKNQVCLSFFNVTTLNLIDLSKLGSNIITSSTTLPMNNLKNQNDLKVYGTNVNATKPYKSNGLSKDAEMMFKKMDLNISHSNSIEENGGDYSESYNFDKNRPLINNLIQQEKQQGLVINLLFLVKSI